VLATKTRQEWKLTGNDRCDAGRCGAQAYVEVKGMSGDLLFCSHHYEKIMADPVGYSKMMSFMLELVDERDRLIENRLVGEN
jgi:hypothetical protein